MFQSIWEDAKREFNYGNMVTRIIIVNISVFLLVNIIAVFFFLAGQIDKYPVVIKWLSLSSDWQFNLTHPWVIFTHMFLHDGFWHILWNMLMLYWFGRIVGDFLGNQRILPLYLLGGLAGGVAYFISAQVNMSMAIGDMALGASAAVMAIVVAAGIIAPNYIMNLLLIGPVKLKYIVAVLVLLNIFSIARIAPNAGGNIAHLGGAAFGWFFVLMLREGNDLSIPINRIINSISNFFNQLFNGAPKSPPRKKKPHVAYKNTNTSEAKKATKKTMTSRRGNASSDHGTLSQQERVDAILDKIKMSGYDSLSQEEKEILFKASKE